MSSKDALDIDHSVQLSDATLSALHISQQPFAPLEGEGATFLDETTTEQLADVKQALITGDDLLLILGSEGAGKSVLLKQLGENSGLRIQCFAVKGSPRFSTLNLFAGMLEAFKRPPPEKLKDILDELIPCLQTMVSRNTLSAIVLDDAHRVTETELTQLLSGMLYLNSQDETLLRVALAAPAEFEDRIPDLLPEGADLPYSSLTIDGLSPARAAEYLAYRFDTVGFDGEWPFSDRDIDNLVNQSGGLPGPLHVVTATSLNQRYGPVDDILPEALETSRGESFMQSRVGKIALGILATVLIAGGISMFLPKPSDTDDGRYANSTATTQDAGAEETTLRLVETTPLTVSAANPDAPAESEQPDTNGDSATSGAANEGTSNDTLMNETDAASEGSSSQTDALTDNVSVLEDITGAVTESANTGSGAPAGSDNSAAAQDAGSTEAEPDTVEDTTPVVIVAESGPTDSAVDAESGSDLSTGDTQSQADSAGAAQESDVATEPADAESANAEPAPDAAPIDETVTDVDPALVGILESPTWILVQDPSLFTVQMSASRDRASVENFLKRNTEALPAPNSIYTFIRSGETWFALLNGLYPSIDQARTAVEAMPAPALTNQPWIRSVRRVQDVLRAQ